MNTLFISDVHVRVYYVHHVHDVHVKVSTVVMPVYIKWQNLYLILFVCLDTEIKVMMITFRWFWIHILYIYSTYSSQYECMIVQYCTYTCMVLFV